MNTAVLPTAEHLRLLRALGVQPLTLRRAPPAASDTPATPAAPIAAAPAAPAPAASATSAAPAQCVLPLIVLLPTGAAADARQQALLRAALMCLSPALQRAPCVELDAHAETLPAAAAYLVLGTDTLAALGRRLPLDVQSRACIACSDTPAEMLAQPARKRGLWRALKTLRARHAEAV